MSHYHAAVWIDHHKALAWHFTATEQTSQHIQAHDQHQRVHTRKSEHGGHRAGADHKFFDEVATALEGAHEILVMGPAQTKTEFVTYLQDKHAQLAKAIVAVESADHPSDAQVLAYARKHFVDLDRMLA